MADDIKSQAVKIVLQIGKQYGKLSQKHLHWLAGFIGDVISQNFGAHGRWDGSGTGLLSGGSGRWKPLAPSTRAQYAKKGWLTEPTLYRSAAAGLRKSITVQPFGDHSIELGSDKPYAAIHQFGGVINRRKTRSHSAIAEHYGKKQGASQTVMPARPYLTLTPQDVKEMIEGLTKKMMEG